MNVKREEHNSVHSLLTMLAIISRNVFYIAAWSFVILLGIVIFRLRISPFDLIFGLPMFLIGLGFVIHYLWSILLVIFSPLFNKAICFFCKNVV